MIPIPRFLNDRKRKYMAIGACYFFACLVLYCAGVLYIQFMLFLAAMALFPVLIMNERANMNADVNEANLSADERWSKKKKELDKIRDVLRKSKDSMERRNLSFRARSIENELRQIEWKIRESDLTQLYNASRGKLREMPDLKDNDHRERRGNEKEYQKFLLRTLKESDRILENEPVGSLKEALIPLSNDLRAHYDLLKKHGRDDSGNLVSNYFAAWGLISSLSGGVEIDKNLSRYTSPSFRKRFEKLRERATARQAEMGYEWNPSLGEGEGMFGSVATGITNVGDGLGGVRPAE